MANNASLQQWYWRLLLHMKIKITILYTQNLHYKQHSFYKLNFNIDLQMCLHPFVTLAMLPNMASTITYRGSHDPPLVIIWIIFISLITKDFTRFEIWIPNRHLAMNPRFIRTHSCSSIFEFVCQHTCITLFFYYFLTITIANVTNMFNMAYGGYVRFYWAVAAVSNVCRTVFVTMFWHTVTRLNLVESVQDRYAVVLKMILF